uniref:Surface protein d n=1 Tax=Babesia bovis TaxID=5865 RepID=S6B428_BABBO|nr:surface protein d [Babesia bovis]
MIGRRILVVAIAMLYTFVHVAYAQGHCAETDLRILGLSKDSVTEESLKKLAITRYVVKSWVRWRPILFPNNPRLLMANIFKDLLHEGIEPFNPNCLVCLIKQAQCVDTTCHASCNLSEYSVQCIHCIDKFCYDDVIHCVGAQMIRMIQHKDVFQNDFIRYDIRTRN